MATRSAASNKGTNASKTLGSPAAPRSSEDQQRRGRRLRTAKKKERSHPLPVRRIAPSPKKLPKDDVGFTDWSSPSRPNDYRGEGLKKKERSHPLPS